MFRKSLSIELVEPMVYLRGHPKDKHTINILRGLIRFKLSYSTIIQAVTIQFVGTVKTLWPEAAQHWDKHIIVDSMIPISRSPIMLKKGIHAFPFEILLSNALSESIECGLGHVRYKLICQLFMKPVGSWASLSPFQSHLSASCPVVLVRLPHENVPRCITQTHILDPSLGSELHILVETAHITPGKPLAISFFFSRPPCSVDRICCKLIERQKFRARAKRSTRILHHEITLTPSKEPEQQEQELRCTYLVPDNSTLRVHPSTSNPNIRVRHWIQISIVFTMRDGVSKEILMDAPVSVLMDTIEDSLTLPAYQTIQNQHHAILPHISSPSSACSSYSSSSISLSSMTWLKKLNPRRNSRTAVEITPPPRYQDIASQENGAF
ncbi:hypothetical protein BX666DRAFT_1952978 [Dichotomocladium elegans]|nr:hypothetical protein BX666DRAFT_1952978 [Dichotomocladium elegans]